MSNFTRTDIPDRGRITFSMAPTVAEIDVDVSLPMSVGPDVITDVTRAQITAACAAGGITPAQLLATLRAIRASAVTRGGGT